MWGEEALFKLLRSHGTCLIVTHTYTRNSQNEKKKGKNLQEGLMKLDPNVNYDIYLFGVITKVGFRYKCSVEK